MRQYKTLEKLREKVLTFPEEKKKLGFEILNDAIHDLCFWPSYYREILRDTKESILSIEEDED